MKKILFLLTIVVFAINGCSSGFSYKSTITESAPTFLPTATATPKPITTPTVAKEILPTCLQPGYDWRTAGGEVISLPFPNNEVGTVHIATAEEIPLLEGGLLPGETWLIVDHPYSVKSKIDGVILGDGGIFYLKRAEKGWARGYAITVCKRIIWYAPLPLATAPAP